MSNVAKLIGAAGRANPGAVFGTFKQQDRLDSVLERAAGITNAFRRTNLQRGDIVAFIGVNSASYVVTWLAAQLLGLQTALLNPAYPDEFLEGMLDDLVPTAIVWIGRTPGSLAERPIAQFDATDAWNGTLLTLTSRNAGSRTSGGGEECGALEIAAYIHTSGTTGRPKFCALSHSYFLRLGRFFADMLSLSHFDTVANPLPLFHINPIGQTLTGALTAGAGFLSSEKFSAPEFWPLVKRDRATALVLHAAPAGVLKNKTSGTDAEGHCVRIAFFCDSSFLRQFNIPIGVGGYGSTEAGGCCHSWKFRPDDSVFPAEGPLHLSGQPRYDIECRISEAGEILVRGRGPGVLFSGYAKAGSINPNLDPDGWFHTGDRGRMDPDGNLIFIERNSESIRVNAEYVPVDLVEERLKRVASLGDFALWRIDSSTKGHEAVVYTTSQAVDLDELRRAVTDLPRYMHPTQIIAIAEIPRDAGVAKIQRRLLGGQPVLHVTPVR